MTRLTGNGASVIEDIEDVGSQGPAAPPVNINEDGLRISLGGGELVLRGVAGIDESVVSALNGAATLQEAVRILKTAKLIDRASEIELSGDIKDVSLEGQKFERLSINANNISNLNLRGVSAKELAISQSSGTCENLTLDGARIGNGKLESLASSGTQNSMIGSTFVNLDVGSSKLSNFKMMGMKVNERFSADSFNELEPGRSGAIKKQFEGAILNIDREHFANTDVVGLFDGIARRLAKAELVKAYTQAGGKHDDIIKQIYEAPDDRFRTTSAPLNGLIKVYGPNGEEVEVSAHKSSQQLSVIKAGGTEVVVPSTAAIGALSRYLESDGEDPGERLKKYAKRLELEAAAVLPVKPKQESEAQA